MRKLVYLVKPSIFVISIFFVVSAILLTTALPDTALAQDVYKAKGASAHFHRGPSGSRVGSVYKNLPLKITETKGDWVKVEIDAWLPKSSITRKKSKSAKKAVGASVTSSALALDSFSLQRRGDYSGEDKKAVLELRVKNLSKKPIKNWEGLLIVKDRASDKLLFRYPVASDIKEISPGRSKKFLFGWGDDTDQYHSLLSYENPKQELKVLLVNIKTP